ncbi:MAG: histidine triad nucleotide-binding protein [Candidatus Desantisbacteria bacterium]
MSDCIFCSIINKQIPAAFLYEDEDIAAFSDTNPQAPVHILIVPKKHIPTVIDIEENSVDLIGKIYLVAKKLAFEQGISEQGFRVVVNCNHDAGQEVFHIHFHLLGGRKMTWPPG